ncbi:MAG: NAD(P)/FAD-dependent oxidoreductase [Pseudonocardia sp.]|nr:NAD(P)/FAD-dependent oxidoreductase [Pseudonocardia sp.]
MPNGLADLERQAHADLHAIRFPDRDWVVPRTGPNGEHVYDVIIVGAGHCGLTAAFALTRRRITNIRILESNEPGRQGPWKTYGRMHTLRSPKHFNGPDLDIPSLTCQAWYTAQHGEEAWHRMTKLPREDWQDYLSWFRKVTNLSVSYQTRVTGLTPLPHGLLRIYTLTNAGGGHLLARKVVFATGADGSGGWTVPQEIRANIPSSAYNQIADDIDFTQLAGKTIGVLGGGASAYDNAATALEQGAKHVTLFFRRPHLHRINPHHWTEFAGFLGHFRDLPDAWRWRFMRHILPLNEPPPPGTFRRAIAHPNFKLVLGSSWANVRYEHGLIRLTAGEQAYTFDHLLIAIGLTQDLRLRPELATIEPVIARWKDRYTPPESETHEGLSEFPYLGPNLEYVERTPGTAPYLADIYNFSAAATVSHGPSGASINGMKQAAIRLADGICRDLFEASVEIHYQDLLNYATPELDVPWPVAANHAPSSEIFEPAALNRS